MGEALAHRRAGSGPPLVLVHGYLGGSAQWAAQIAHLSARHYVIAPDLPGFGGSAVQPAPTRIGGFAEAVLALLDRLGIGSFILLGHSMGGMVVQEMAARAGDRIRGLVLYGTGPLGLMPDRFETLDASRARLKTDGVPATARRIAATWFVAGNAAPGFALAAEIGARASMQAGLAGLDAMENWDGRPAVARLTMPSLVLWGDCDLSYRWPQVAALWQGLPSSTLAILPGASHAAHLEQPALFAALLDDYLGSLPGRSARAG